MNVLPIEKQIAAIAALTEGCSICATERLAGIHRDTINAAAVALFIAHYNLCRVHEALRMTPAMALGVTDPIWTIAELIAAAETGAIEAQGKRVGCCKVIDDGAS